MSDVGNCEAIRIARNVDEFGHRTIGVVTKIDNVREGSNIMDQLMGNGNVTKLALGFVAVRNRSPMEVKANLPLNEVFEKEKAFFENEPLLQGLPQEYWGLPTLANKIMDVQAVKVNEFITKSKSKLYSLLTKIRGEIDELQPTFSTDGERQAFFNRAIGQITSEFKDLSLGKLSVDDEGMHVMARLYEEFERYTVNAVKDKPKGGFLDGEYFKVVKNHMRELRGVNLSNFMSSPVFKLLKDVAYQNALLAAGNELVDRASEIISGVINKIICDVLSDEAHENLREELLQLVVEFIDLRATVTKDSIRQITDSEGYVFTINHYYSMTIKKVHGEIAQLKSDAAKMATLRRTNKAAVEGGASTAAGLGPGAAGEPDEQSEEAVLMNKFFERCADASEDDSSCMEMQLSLHVYSKVLEKRNFDYVPMMVHLHMITAVYDSTNSDDLSVFFHKNMHMQLANVLSESPIAVSKRRKLVERAERVKAAYDELRVL